MTYFERVESLFHRARDLGADVDVIAWLRQNAAGDESLVAEVSSLIQANDQMHGDAEPKREDAVPAAQFGVYRAVERIGSGGMSKVYRARRTVGDFEQIVALKVMAGYLSGPEFLQRFHTERRLLASLNHHNITRLIDGGISSAGDPYLVTEYVEGLPLDAYCDKRKLDIQERIRLFLQVATAVDFAHRNLIVHRDLKPSNVLVNQEGVAKLLDFGTAALIPASFDAPVTRLRMLTPRYASPEQLRGERAGTSADVFALGVILYESLCGSWPFGNPGSALSELERALGKTEPAPLSQSLTGESAESRSIAPAHLSRLLKGDLSAIVLKALENEPGRRYESVRALASDLENYLAGRPVNARPQTIMYRAGKLLRRHWLATAVTALFVISLAVAVIVAIRQAQTARAQALKTQRVNEFLNLTLTSPASLSFDPKQVTVAEMIEAAEARLEKSWADDPTTEASLRRSIGESYVALLRFDRGRPELERALAIFQRTGDQNEIAETQVALADLEAYQGHSEDAVEHYRQARARLEKGGRSAGQRVLFEAEVGIAQQLFLVQHRNLSEAAALLEDAVRIARSDRSIPRTRLASAMAASAAMLDPKESDRAAAIYREALDIGRREDPDGVWQVEPLYYLALAIRGKNQAEATEIARQRFEILQRHYGPNHGLTAIAGIQWARGRAESGFAEEMVPQVMTWIATVRDRYPSPSMDRWVALSATAHILNRAKRYQPAEAAGLEMLQIIDANRLPDKDPRREESLIELGTAQLGRGKYAVAAKTLEMAVANSEDAVRAEQAGRLLDRARAGIR